MSVFTPSQLSLINDLADKGERVLTVVKFQDKICICGTKLIASGKTPEEALGKLKERVK